MTEAYIEGFCKAAADHGVDPLALVRTTLSKRAQQLGPTVDRDRFEQMRQRYQTDLYGRVARGIPGYVSGANPGSTWVQLHKPAWQTALARVHGALPPERPAASTYLRSAGERLGGATSKKPGRFGNQGTRQVQTYYQKMRNALRVPLIRLNDPALSH